MLALTFLRDLLMPMAKQNIKLCQKVTYYNAAFVMPKICNASIIDYFFSLRIISLAAFYSGDVCCHCISREKARIFAHRPLKNWVRQ